MGDMDSEDDLALIEAYSEGEQAREDGEPRGANPYLDGELREAWEDGWGA